jgi:hypothetical protein
MAIAEKTIVKATCLTVALQSFLNMIPPGTWTSRARFRSAHPDHADLSSARGDVDPKEVRRRSIHKSCMLENGRCSPVRAFSTTPVRLRAP